MNVPVMVRGMGLLKIYKLISDLRRYSLLRIVPLKSALGPTCPNFPALIDLWNGHVYPPSLVLFLPIKSNKVKYFYLFKKTTFFDYFHKTFIFLDSPTISLTKASFNSLAILTIPKYSLYQSFIKDIAFITSSFSICLSITFLELSLNFYVSYNDVKTLRYKRN